MFTVNTNIWFFVAVVVGKKQVFKFGWMPSKASSTQRITTATTGTTTIDPSIPRRANYTEPAVMEQIEFTNDDYGGPVDLDELFMSQRNMMQSREEDDFSLDELNAEDESLPMLANNNSNHNNKFFSNPHKRLLDNDASLIPGSPFSKPPNRRSNRPSEPLAIAKYASTTAFLITVGWVVFLLMVPFWNFTSVGRIIIEMILALLSFFGLFWNSYFVTAMIFKCFIPKKAFLTNTKYCSIIPENKPEQTPWLDVTIQIPVYKESLHEVLMPTLKSCLTARDYYRNKTGAKCNIVVCDDGMMAFCKYHICCSLNRLPSFIPKEILGTTLSSFFFVFLWTI